MWARRRFGIRVTAVSFIFTAATMFTLAIVQQAMQESGRTTSRIFGVSVPLPPVDGPAASLALFSVAVLLWGALVSLSQLVVARQVRSYLRVETAAITDTMGFISERMMIEAYLGFLSNGARAVALTAVLAYLLAGWPALGLVVSILVVGVVAVRRFRHAGVLQTQWRAASQEWRAAQDSRSHLAITQAMYTRDAYLHRLPFAQLGIMLLVVLTTVVLPAWLNGAAAGGAGLLIMLVWIQALLGTAAGAGSLGWRWAHRVLVRSRGQDGSAPDLLDGD